MQINSLRNTNARKISAFTKEKVRQSTRVKAKRGLGGLGKTPHKSRTVVFFVVK